MRVKSQSYKKNGKNTIGFLGKGKNTNFPYIYDISWGSKTKVRGLDVCTESLLTRDQTIMREHRLRVENNQFILGANQFNVC